MTDGGGVPHEARHEILVHVQISAAEERRGRESTVVGIQRAPPVVRAVELVLQVDVQPRRRVPAVLGSLAVEIEIRCPRHRAESDHAERPGIVLHQHDAARMMNVIRVAIVSATQRKDRLQRRRVVFGGDLNRVEGGVRGAVHADRPVGPALFRQPLDDSDGVLVFVDAVLVLGHALRSARSTDIDVELRVAVLREISHAEVGAHVRRMAVGHDVQRARRLGASAHARRNEKKRRDPDAVRHPQQQALEPNTRRQHGWRGPRPAGYAKARGIVRPQIVGVRGGDPLRPLCDRRAPAGRGECD